MNIKPYRVSILSAIAFLLLACNLPLLRPTATPTPVPVPTQITTPTPTPTATPVVNLPYSDRVLHDEGNDPKYTVDIHYPYFDGQDDFNAAMEDRILELGKSFVRDVDNSKDIPAPEGTYSALETQSTVRYAGYDLISVELTVSQYLTGAAHPNAYTITVNYDLATARTLTLDDVLAVGGLETVSKYCIDTLQRTGELEWAEGAAPQAEYYQNWNFDRQGLIITFDPYQVGSYAAGFHKVTIPYSDLEPVLKPGTPLERIMK
jgi:hypothetical protein